MRYYQFRRTNLKFSAVLNIEANTLIGAKALLGLLIKDPENWVIENETTIMEIISRDPNEVRWPTE